MYIYCLNVCVCTVLLYADTHIIGVCIYICVYLYIFSQCIITSRKYRLVFYVRQHNKLKRRLQALISVPISYFQAVTYLQFHVSSYVEILSIHFSKEKKTSPSLSFIPVLPHIRAPSCTHLQNSFNQFEIQALGIITTKVYVQPALI